MKNNSMIEKLIIILRSTDSFGKRKKFLWNNRLERKMATI